MGAPTNTYSSNINLNLGHVPPVEDRNLYEYLLDLHNALEILVTAQTDAVALDNKITLITTDYAVLATDRTIFVDASAGSIIITLPASGTVAGAAFDIKVLAQGTGYTISVIGFGAEIIDDYATGVGLDIWEDITCRSKTTLDTPSLTGYAII